MTLISSNCSYTKFWQVLKLKMCANIIKTHVTCKGKIQYAAKSIVHQIMSHIYKVIINEPNTYATHVSYSFLQLVMFHL